MSDNQQDPTFSITQGKTAINILGVDHFTYWFQLGSTQYQVMMSQECFWKLQNIFGWELDEVQEGY